MPIVWEVVERKKRPLNLPWGEREGVLRVLEEALRGREEVALAIVYGSFLQESMAFRDIDVAVHTLYRVDYDRWPYYKAELEEWLEERLYHAKGLLKKVDVLVLEYAPYPLVLEALRGRALFEKTPGLAKMVLKKAIEERQAIEIKTRLHLGAKRPARGQVEGEGDQVG